MYNIKFSQFIPQPIDKVFAFFARPENLECITPKNLKFSIKTLSPIRMETGQIIDYNIKIKGFPLRWRSLISSYDPPYRFIDEQIRGPYSKWHHTHTFTKENGGTKIDDQIEYSLPFGLLGRITHSIWIKKDLEKIFEYRSKTIEKVFRKDINE